MRKLYVLQLNVVHFLTTVDFFTRAMLKNLEIFRLSELRSMGIL